MRRGQFWLKAIGLSAFLTIVICMVLPSTEKTNDLFSMEHADSDEARNTVNHTFVHNLNKSLAFKRTSL